MDSGSISAPSVMDARASSSDQHVDETNSAATTPVTLPMPTLQAPSRTPMDPPPQPRAERYLSYEEFREQEPPQARLLRLRGLFELLVDQDSSSALAGGRAKQMWRARASRARYGAGGALATGSLVDQKEPVHAAKAAHQREWLALVRRNRYASELLAECRKRHAELEKQQREAQGHGDQHSLQDTLWSKWHSVVSLVHEELSVEDKPSIWASIQNLLSSDMPSMLMSRESGWTGSRVWGLQARENGSHGHDTPTPTCTATSSNDKERARQRQIEWEGFVAYAEFQERALYSLFGEIDTNKDGMLDEEDIQAAFDKAGIRMTHVVLDDFIASIASSGVQDVKELHARDLYVTFPEFRDYLLLLPRKPTVPEIFRFYQVRKAVGLFGTEGIFAELGAAMGKTARGVTHVNFDGDMTYSGELDRDEKKQGKETDGCVEEEEASTKDNEPSEDAKPKSDMIQFDVAAKFLLAGGLAGAVSRTATAPFDRLKIFLMTSRASLSPAAMGQGATTTKSGFGALAQGMITIYQEGGLRGFWLGNGLNCMKIIPESAIKFFTYEYMKRFFAKYVDGVSDSRDISGMSRFVSGGVGGITSQLSIYPIETLKTRLMSSMNNQGHVRGMALLCQTAREMWQRGRFRAYYRGLGAGLLGVFPYSAIDMSTFEGTKLFYLRYTGKDEPGVLALLAFGSFSGSVGAATVYPLNLVRTRLQASGTPAHPFIYKSLWDATYQTFQREGILGFYRGLIPTLAKVVPAVSISYVVYDRAKKTLGVA